MEEIEKMSLEEFSKLLPARQRRSLKHGFTKQEKKLLENVRKHKGQDKLIRTHAREAIIIPEMVGTKLGIYNGHEYINVTVTPEMLGRYLGEFSLTRQRVKHSSPGLGATRSSKFVPTK